MKFQTATRVGVTPLIAFYGESGSGKTMSALLLARGLVGPDGKIGLIDTESRRGQLYADVIPGGYECLELESPFSPARYIEAHDTAEASKFAAIVYDSASHEWEGIGGVLDMASDNEARSGKPGLHCWKKPKLEHAHFVQRLLRSSVPVIICLRAKYKSRQVRNANGKNEIVKDEMVSPIQAEDFIFEMTAHAEIRPDHTITLTKCSHPRLRDCFPADGKAPISVETGEKVAQWAKAGSGSAPQEPKAGPTKDALKKSLWKLVKDACNNDVPTFELDLRSKGLLGADDKLADMTAEQLADAIAVYES